MLGLLAGIGGMLGGFHESRPINQSFDYTANTGGMQGMSNKLQTQGDQLFDPNSDFYSRARGHLTEQIGQGVAQDSLAQNRMLASRGVGSGAISNMLDMVNSSGIGEEARKGQQGMYAQGMNVGSNLYGQAGGLESQIGQMKDSAKQFGLTSKYNQTIDNRERRMGFFNQLASSFNPFDK